MNNANYVGMSLSEVVELKLAEAKEEKNNIGLFTIKTGREWLMEAKNCTVPKMLFDEFWFENELCILFADCNLGKSILAVQIGNSISNGDSIKGFRFEAPKQKVLYFDFELSMKQFENRYSLEYQNHYTFDDNFLRVELNPDIEFPIEQNFEDFLNDSFEMCIKQTNAKVLIVDNITYLKNETEKAKDALPLMKHLKALKTKYGLSILCLAHTPKRDLSKPITRNDLSGSKALINFCDSCFTIGESVNDKAQRYIKQIKVRQTEFRFDTTNVAVCRLHKPYNFLGFEFIGFDTEKEHLRQISDDDNDKKIRKL